VAATRGGAQVLARSDTAVRLRTAATGSPYFVVAGTGFDARWRASADGVDLGPPLLLDGYSAGWRVADGAAHVVAIRYGPARAAAWAAALSAAGLVSCVLIVALAAAARRRPGPWLILPFGPRQARRAG
jgi:arabinofuranan 3-O-arabinosyltransferase